MTFNLSRGLILAAAALATTASSVLLFPTAASAQGTHTKAEPPPTAGKLLPPPDIFRPYGVLRQDLYDRNNPTNRHSDYPAPPSQPGQF